MCLGLHKILPHSVFYFDMFSEVKPFSILMLVLVNNNTSWVFVSVRWNLVLFSFNLSYQRWNFYLHQRSFQKISSTVVLKKQKQKSKITKQKINKNKKVLRVSESLLRVLAPRMRSSCYWTSRCCNNWHSSLVLQDRLSVEKPVSWSQFADPAYRQLCRCLEDTQIPSG